MCAKVPGRSEVFEVGGEVGDGFSFALNGFNGLSIGFPYFTNVVQLLCSLSGWLHLSCSSIGTGFDGAE